MMHPPFAYAFSLRCIVFAYALFDVKKTVVLHFKKKHFCCRENPSPATQAPSHLIRMVPVKRYVSTNTDKNPPRIAKIHVLPNLASKQPKF
jgi:hypothetical protein